MSEEVSVSVQVEGSVGVDAQIPENPETTIQTPEMINYNPPTVSVGTTTTLPAGQNASVTNSGTEKDLVLNFSIPKGDKGDKGDPGDSGYMKSIGEVYFSQSSSAADNPGGLPLFTGETISNADEVYPDFYDWVADHSDLQISAANYEAALTTYGECPKYVIDTENKTIRLPKLVNYIKMGNAVDGVTQTAAGLPEVKALCNTGNSNAWSNIPSYAEDVTNSNGYQILAGSSIPTTTTLHYIESKASLSSSVYGNSNTVTPAHTTVFPWVYAYNTAVPASTAQAAEFQAALTGKADTSLANISPSGETVIEKIVDDKMKVDWSGLISVSVDANNVFTAPSNGFIYGYLNQADAANYNIGVNGTTLQWQGTGQFNQGSSYAVYVSKGDSITVYVNNGYRYFVPVG